MNDNLTFYSKNAQLLSQQYDSVPFESVHKGWLDLIPTNGFALDIGAGSGRDARYLASRGLNVYALEPVLSLMENARNKSAQFDITWLQDSLPQLFKVTSLANSFDLILLSAVWMHLSPEERKLSIQNLAPLLNKKGKLVITLRHGKFNDARTAFPISVEEIHSLSAKSRLKVILQTQPSKDQLGRNDIAWQTLVLEK